MVAKDNILAIYSANIQAMQIQRHYSARKITTVTEKKIKFGQTKPE